MKANPVKEPEILTKIVDFFKFWQNPDNSDDEYLPIKEFQLRVFDVSYDFIFKWMVSDKDIKSVSEFTNIEIKNNRLCLSVGEYVFELEGYGE